jgi:hypothetical protein
MLRRGAQLPTAEARQTSNVRVAAGAWEGRRKTVQGRTGQGLMVLAKRAGSRARRHCCGPVQGRLEW